MNSRGAGGLVPACAPHRQLVPSRQRAARQWSNSTAKPKTDVIAVPKGHGGLAENHREVGDEHCRPPVFAVPSLLGSQDWTRVIYASAAAMCGTPRSVASGPL